MNIKRVLFIILMALSSAIQAQTCVGGITETSPAANFTDNGDGTVTDTTTGLMWSRCSIGQTWSVENSNCTGNATAMTWQEALQVTYGYEFGTVYSTVKLLSAKRALQRLFAASVAVICAHGFFVCQYLTEIMPKIIYWLIADS